MSTVRLGRTQKLVLRLLASGSGPKSARYLAYDFPALTESAAQSAILRLGLRGLVDVAGWESDSNRRTYKLTEEGREIERSLNVSDEDEDTDEA